MLREEREVTKKGGSFSAIGRRTMGKPALFGAKQRRLAFIEKKRLTLCRSAVCARLWMSVRAAAGLVVLSLSATAGAGTWSSWHTSRSSLPFRLAGLADLGGQRSLRKLGTCINSLFRDLPTRPHV